MKSAKKELWLFTMRYPYGKGEAFLENELPVLCRHFERVVVMPEFVEGARRSMPAYAIVRDPEGSPYQRATLWELVRYFTRAFDLWRSLREDAPAPEAITKERRWLLNRVLQAVHRAAFLERMLRTADAPVLYAYWSHDHATALALVRAGDPRVTFISRAHGFDLYKHQHARGWIPFRNYQLRHVERNYAVSTAGLEYLREQYPAHANKFALSTLGTTDHGMNPWTDPQPVRIVSCSFLIPRKRVDLWIDVLSRVTVPVEWTHFGDGPERALLEARAASLPSHVRVTWMGGKSNTEIMAWYAVHPVHLFALFSELEGGVAVAAQEAASFGIPLLVTDSGGVRDLVNEHTGLLLPTHPDVAEVARWIDAFAGSRWCSAEARAGVRAYWQSHFHATTVFDRFCLEALGSGKAPSQP